MTFWRFTEYLASDVLYWECKIDFFRYSMLHAISARSSWQRIVFAKEEIVRWDKTCTRCPLQFIAVKIITFPQCHRLCRKQNTFYLGYGVILAFRRVRHVFGRRSWVRFGFRFGRTRSRTLRSGRFYHIKLHIHLIDISVFRLSNILHLCPNPI